MKSDLLDHFLAQWSFLRSLTYDFIESTSESDLSSSPSSGVSPLWKQFRHVGRVQENYLSALDSGVIKFTTEGCSFVGGSDKQRILSYLRDLDDKLQGTLKSIVPSISIHWFGERLPLAKHLLCLADHEVIHHGQWMVYRSISGGKFPPTWSVWGL
jgi:uncharacterized damage-inducible protein DinB